MKTAHFALLGAAILVSSSCGDVVRDGKSPVFLQMTSLAGARGSTSAGSFSTGLVISDVVTNVTSPAPCSSDTPCPTIFGDPGQATLSTVLKNVGSAGLPTNPTTNNDVTITRYHVEYVRTDGRNTPGVDVPYAFDGATTGVIPVNGNAQFGFELVRSVAKEEAPLVTLKTSSVVLKLIANVTFYGQDQVGNELNVTGSITIECANYGDF